MTSANPQRIAGARARRLNRFRERILVPTLRVLYGLRQVAEVPGTAPDL